MPVGINFGSATSGNGFDVATTVSSIMALQRTPETAWKARVTALQAQDTALSTIGTHLSDLSTALQTLTSFDGALSQKAGASSDSSNVALTAADSTSRAGTHSVFVTQLAQTSTEYSSNAASSDTLSGSLTVQVGSGSAQTINIDSSNNTLSTLAAAINGASLGVTATVISDSNGARLSLASAKSGAAGQITMGGVLTNDATQTAVTFQQGQAGSDARFTVDGISMSSATNTVTSAISGVTLQLLGTSTKAAQVEIANDTSSVSTAISAFITAYNAVVDDVAAQEGKDSSGNAKPLFGSTVLSSIQSQLSSALGTASSGSGAVQYLSQLGITTGTDGKLSLDTTALGNALNSSFSDVQSFFQTAGNFGQSLVTAVNGLSSSSTYGAIRMALAQNSDEETRMNDNVSKLEERLALYETSMTSKLTTANQILQSIPQKLDEVQQIYDAITGTKS